MDNRHMQREAQKNPAQYESVVVEEVGDFNWDTADNRRYWSMDWYITGKKK